MKMLFVLVVLMSGCALDQFKEDTKQCTKERAKLSATAGFIGPKEASKWVAKCVNRKTEERAEN